MRVSVLLDNKLCQEEPVDRNGENAIFCTHCKLKYYGGNRKKFVTWILNKIYKIY